MEDLTVVGHDGEYILLLAQDGITRRLKYDDSLTHTIKKIKSLPINYQVNISPKKIQAQLRSGYSAEKISKELEIDIEHVQKYELPVKAEIEYIFNLAMNTPFILNQNKIKTITFKEHIHNTITNDNGKVVQWICKRHPNSPWIIELKYTVKNVNDEKTASWNFNNKNRELVPINLTAEKLSKQNLEGYGLIPMLEIVDKEKNIENSIFEEKHEKISNKKDAKNINVFSNNQESNFGNTAELIETLKKHRIQKDNTDKVLNNSSDESKDPIDEFKEYTDDKDDIDQDESSYSPGTNTQEINKSQKLNKKRKEMPSWDDILFGKKNND